MHKALLFTLLGIYTLFNLNSYSAVALQLTDLEESNIELVTNTSLSLATTDTSPNNRSDLIKPKRELEKKPTSQIEEFKPSDEAAVFIMDTEMHSSHHTKHTSLEGSSPIKSWLIIAAAILFSAVLSVLTYFITRNKSVVYRFFACSGSILGVTTLMSVIVYVDLNIALQKTSLISRDDIPILTTLADAEARMLEQALYLEKYLSKSQEAYTEAFIKRGKEVKQELMDVEKLLEHAKNHSISENDQKAYSHILGEVIKLEKLHDEFDKTGERLVEAKKNDNTSLVSDLTQTVAKQEFDMRKLFNNVINQEKEKTIASALETEAASREAQLVQIVGAVTALVVGLILAFFMGVQVNKSLLAISSRITNSTDSVNENSAELSRSCMSIADGASQQAAAFEETSASMEEISSTVNTNVEHVENSKRLADSALSSAQAGVDNMGQMKNSVEAISESSDELHKAMSDIKSSSESISKIIKSIDEIAFQTNILALNAAVEAARAGEAGMGFAVVADEVRNLAKRSADAARETSEMIEDANLKGSKGVEVSESILTKLQQVVSSTGKLETNLLEIQNKVHEANNSTAEIETSSKEQSVGITQVNEAITQMDQVTQQNAATAEENASLAQELSNEGRQLKGIIDDLNKIVLKKGSEPSKPVYSAPVENTEPSNPPSLTASVRKNQPAQEAVFSDDDNFFS
ncbi:MAG: methyl-accepting chemotaxis protein [Verrucomicrobiota bacterium]